MFLDAYLQLSTAQQVTADAVTEKSVDIGALTAQREIAVGEPMAMTVSILAIGTNSGSAKFQVIESAAADLGSGTRILGEVDLLTADIVAGKQFVVPLSQGVLANLRYVGGYFDITGTVDFTVDVYLQPLSMASREKSAIYAKGYTIS